ncbi:hypothetical protein A4H97_18175 [Niastella yeongjuensis]|uniref:Uncharacterized protein n=1 Tax=Niastella yeongjuensis TaxID=354355 RepID=A0A1V9DXX2_9BACT|nr:hypothetical protein [Niastella yeongjuensis]OQP38649.1 hypothetical protein A4H97_18175 [Niastella yeongjuensis]SEO38106.1 hypothetical protein SAMN05660816_02768 [Niastella yeongjuensis]
MAGRGDKNKQGGQAFADNRPTEKKPANRKSYDLVVDDVPYLVSAEAFTYNDEQRYYVTVNGGPQHVFIWDTDLKRLTALDTDEDSATLPEALEEALSKKLQQETA